MPQKGDSWTILLFSPSVHPFFVYFAHEPNEELIDYEKLHISQISRYFLVFILRE